MRGNTTVTVFGTDFRNEYELYCRFGTHAQQRGLFVKTNHVICWSPSDYTTPTATVEISFNNQDFTSDAIVFGFQGAWLSVCTYPCAPWWLTRACALADATVVSMQEPKGSRCMQFLSFLFLFVVLAPHICLQVGGTVVTVTGTNFVNSPNLRCRFDQLEGNGTFLSASTVRCVSPEHVIATVPVEISNNNQDFTRSGVGYRFIGMSERVCVIRWTALTVLVSFAQSNGMSTASIR
jgi:hypothetical protein